MPNAPRTAQVDAVLAALGYKSDKPRVARAAAKIVGVACVVLLLLTWFVRPPWREMLGARGDARGAIGVERPAVNTPPAGTLPAPAPEANSPVASVPTPAPKPNPV